MKLLKESRHHFLPSSSCSPFVTGRCCGHIMYQWTTSHWRY